MADSEQWRIEWYRTAAGGIPAKTFLASLTGRAKDEAIALLELIQLRGNQIRGPKSKALGGGLFELREHQVRLFYVFRPNRTVVVLDGMIKKQDRIPQPVMDRLLAMQQALTVLDAKMKRGP